MSKTKRTVSLLVRRIKKPFAIKKNLKTFYHWMSEQKNLPLYQPVQNKLLIIRLDDIGDYILWRNSLHFYKLSPRWQHHRITLLGNKNWKDIFDYADTAAVDEVIWVNKADYIATKTYRLTIWIQLRNEGFETVVCPSKTRTEFLDDLCALATGSVNMMAYKKSLQEKKLNGISNGFYKQLYHDNKHCHEFFFNQNFANWCCHTYHCQGKPSFNSASFRQMDKDYLICYISGSTKSKRLSVATWVHFIQLLKPHYSKKILLAGGPAEKVMAEQIAAVTQVDTITGKVSLTDMIHYTAFAEAVITGDTMEAHLAPCCNIPTVIYANGKDYIRFSGYKEAGIPQVETVYSKSFLQAWKKKKYTLFTGYLAVSNDIKTINANDIWQALQKVKPGL